MIVSTSLALMTAMKTAPDGSIVQLAPGTYSNISWKVPPIHTAPITVTSADPAHPAILTDIWLDNAKGLFFTDLILQSTPPPSTIDLDSYFPFKFVDCFDLGFHRVKVQGTLDGKDNDGSGLSFRGCSKTRITETEFQALVRCAAFGVSGTAASPIGCDDILIADNFVHDVRSDGFDFAQVSNVRILRNRLRNFRPHGGATPDHPDAFQFWTSGTIMPSHDILIEGNLIERGEGAYTQGIFIDNKDVDKTGKLHYERVTLRDNLIIGSGYNGIRIAGIKSLTLDRNELITFIDDTPLDHTDDDVDNPTYILIQNGAGIVSTDNRAVTMSFDKCTGIERLRDIITVPVVDKGAAAIAAWNARRNPPKTVEQRLAALEQRVFGEAI